MLGAQADYGVPPSQCEWQEDDKFKGIFTNTQMQEHFSKSDATKGDSGLDNEMMDSDNLDISDLDTSVLRNEIEEMKKGIFPKIENVIAQRQKDLDLDSDSEISLLEAKIKKNLMFFRDQDLVASVLEKDIRTLNFNVEMLLSDISDYFSYAHSDFDTDSLEGEVPENFLKT